MQIKSILFLFLLVAVGFVSCDKDDHDDHDHDHNEYTIPTTYNFDNVSYTGQTQRLDMLGELTTYMKTANTLGTQVTEQTLLNMFRNENSPFSTDELNTTTKQIASKTFADDLAMFEGWMAEMAASSQATEAGSNGVAGVVTSNDGAKSYLNSANGFEYVQLIEKGLMGALIFYQIAEVYTREGKIGDAVDNTTVTEGKGTDMEHHWDEAFGYFGATTDFPANTNGIRYWAKYSNDRDALINCNQAIMDAFLKGRAAISNNDDVAKWEAAIEVRSQIERVAAATAIHYINEAVNNFNDDALRNHTLSEAYAFTGAIKYNSDRELSIDAIGLVQNALGSNFYESDLISLSEARDLLSSTYGFDAVKLEL